MAYQNLLVHLDSSKACDLRVEAAMALAHRYQAHLTGLYLVAAPVAASFSRGYLPPDVTEALARRSEEAAEGVLARFAAAVEGQQLSFETRIDHGFDTEFPDLLSIHARYCDLMIMGQLDPGEASAHRHLTEQVALASGGPLLVVPFTGPAKTSCERVVVAWDASREAARAVTDAMPLLRQAKLVRVVTVNARPGRLGHGAEPGADLALRLARHGVAVEVHHLESGANHVGNTLLADVANENADLLVMGAYGHSRLRELVLGGVTRTVLEEMTVPVLLSH